MYITDYWNSIGSGSSLNQGINNAMAISSANNTFNAGQAKKQMDFQRDMLEAANSFNSSEAEKQRQWEQMMSGSAHQRELADLRASGLNPILAANNGAAVPSGAAASSVSPGQGAKAEADTSANMAIASMFNAAMSYKAQTDAMKTSAESAQRVAQIQADASRYASTTSMYNASLNASTNRAINAAQLANQQRLAEYDFKKQIEYRNLDFTHNQALKQQDLENETWLRSNYPQTNAGIVNKVVDQVSNFKNSVIGRILSGIKSSVIDSRADLTKDPDYFRRKYS